MVLWNELVNETASDINNWKIDGLSAIFGEGNEKVKLSILLYADENNTTVPVNMTPPDEDGDVFGSVPLGKVTYKVGGNDCTFSITARGDKGDTCSYNHSTGMGSRFSGKNKTVLSWSDESVGEKKMDKEAIYHYKPEGNEKAHVYFRIKIEKGELNYPEYSAKVGIGDNLLKKIYDEAKNTENFSVSWNQQGGYRKRRRGRKSKKRRKSKKHRKSRKKKSRKRRRTRRRRR